MWAAFGEEVIPNKENKKQIFMYVFSRDTDILLGRPDPKKPSNSVVLAVGLAVGESLPVVVARVSGCGS